MELLTGAANLPFIPFGEKEFPAEQTSEVVGTLSRMKGEKALQFTVSAVARVMKVKWRELPKLLPANGIDALVLDDYDFYSAVVPMYLGMPYAILSNALHFDYSGYTPLSVYGWAHENTAEARERNRRGVSQFTQMLVHGNAEMIAEVERAGITPNWADPSSLFSDRPWITQCPREFDFENSHWPKQFHYAGPFHDGEGRPELTFPWGRLTGEPIVYASMGTVQNGNADVFRTIATAVAKHKAAQLVLSLGNVLRPEEIGPVPKNAIVVNHAPQLELLKKASVCITHAGFNTVLEALTQGVPQVAIPITNDQPGVAARIATHQTGVVTPLEKLTVSRLATLIDEVLNNSSYRDNARKIQQGIAKINGLSRATDILEQAFGLIPSRISSPTTMSLQSKHDAVKASAPFVAPRLVANLAGSRFVVLAAAPETNGAYSALEIFVPPGAGTPLHAHSKQETVFYMVRGHLRFQVGDGVWEHGPGGVILADRTVPHLFVNMGNAEAVVIVIARPGGIEKFFLEVATEIAATDAPTAATQEEIERILARAPAYGITMFPQPANP
jgi:MGT family glycosyltransferase